MVSEEQFMAKNKVAAMLLAGGKGSRLLDLTRKSAKPGIPFGGKYRIIDFTMSNIANSNINIVGVMTQYESTFLNTYIGNGDNWGLNGVRSLTATLTPRQTEKGSNWYAGTADAIYQNIDFLDNMDPEYVLILSGDHIYRMNYQTMLDAHIKSKADLTIAVIRVPLEEAKRFGIMDVDSSNFITKFTEKPANPSSNLASMGIYLFDYKILRSALIEDDKDNQSEHDFGKNIIPTLLAKKKRILAYQFDGYWKDVGTINSYWEASMDLLNPEIEREFSKDGKLKIFTEDTHSVPQYVGKSASVKDSLINQGAIILGEVDHSIVFNEVILSHGSSIHNSVVMPNVTIEEGVEIDYAIVGPDQVIKKGSILKGEQGKIALFANQGGNL
jgi:glucose-1-phosphate adenylyltransferase